MNADIFETKPTTASTGWGFTDILGFVREGAQQFMAYDLQKEELKYARIQHAAQYNGGYTTPGAYDYTRFADDGGLMGGVTGLRGGQVFLLAIAAIAAYAVVNK